MDSNCVFLIHFFCFVVVPVLLLYSVLAVEYTIEGSVGASSSIDSVSRFSTTVCLFHLLHILYLLGCCSFTFVIFCMLINYSSLCQI